MRIRGNSFTVKHLLAKFGGNFFSGNPKGGFTVDDGLSFRSFRFVSLRFVSFRTVRYRISWFTVDDNSTLTTFVTKWEESDLRSCYFLPFCIEDEEEDCVHRIGGSGSVKSLPKGVNKENFTTSFRRCVWWILKVISGT